MRTKFIYAKRYFLFFFLLLFVPLLQPGWSGYGLGVTKDNNGYVHLEGILTSGLNTSLLVLRVPEDARPVGGMRLFLNAVEITEQTRTHRTQEIIPLYVLENGDLMIPAHPDYSYQIFLDGITYRTKDYESLKHLK